MPDPPVTASVGKVWFSSGSGPFALNTEPERGVRFRQLPNLEPERAFRFSLAFEHVRTQGTSAISGGRNLIEKYHTPRFCSALVVGKGISHALSNTETPANDKLSSRKFTRRLRDSKPSSNDIETALHLPRREGSGMFRGG
jgi:hypothetical protein